MKKIIYKAFVESLNKLLPVVSIQFDFMKVEVAATHLEHIDTELFNFNQVDLIQNINQKDSEGKEIFEGDVVTWYNPLIETGERMTGVVVYDTKQATYKKCPINLYKANAGDGGYTGFEFRWYDNVKVLGNIYENPELLQNQTK